jgi:hypothetical protein
MDALDALSPERPVLSTRLRREREVEEHRTPATHDLADVRRLLAQLPMLVDGSWSPATPTCPDEAMLRMTVALWALAARKDIAVAPEDDAAVIARSLAARGALTPPAAEAVARLSLVLADVSIADGVDACRAAARLTAYLELRARYG